MDNKDSTPHKSSDITAQIEEKDLWDLEDDWDSEEFPDESNEEQDHTTSAKDEPEPDETETVPDSEPAPKKSDPHKKTPVHEDDALVTDDEDDDEEKKLSDSPGDDDTTPDPDPSDTPSPHSDDADPTEDDSDRTLPSDPTSQTDEHHAEVADGADSLAPTRKKLSLSTTEIIALSSLAILLVALAVRGYIYLLDKNKLTETTDSLELPQKWDHATITKLDTFWKVVGKNSAGFNAEAVVVPAASITLGESSSTGALRVFFNNEAQDKIGDTITLHFKNGTFSNGSQTIEINATDGLHQMGDYYAYQVGDGQTWTILIQEVNTDSSKNPHSLTTTIKRTIKD